MLRASYFFFYGTCALLGVASVARPATSWVCALARSGLATASTVPLGWAFMLLGLGLAGCTLAIAVAIATRRTRRLARHAALLVLVAIATTLRVTLEPLPRTQARKRAPADHGPDALPPRDPMFPTYPRETNRAGPVGLDRAVR